MVTLTGFRKPPRNSALKPRYDRPEDQRNHKLDLSPFRPLFVPFKVTPQFVEHAFLRLGLCQAGVRGSVHVAPAS